LNFCDPKVGQALEADQKVGASFNNWQAIRIKEKKEVIWR
jgi:hypothetical protein